MNSDLDVELSSHNRITAARSQFYKILSRVFAYPPDGLQQDFLIETRRQLREAADELPFPVPAIESIAQFDASQGADAENFAVMYSGIFDNCSGRPAVSLHEKDYSKKDTKYVWEELIRFYEHFGLNYDLGRCKEWPDHVGIQLEFLHYLTFLEAGAPEDVADIYVAAEGDFLEKHVADWVPKFSEKLRSMAEDTPYGSLAQVLAQFVEGDTEFNRRRRTIQ
ncbi:ethylbenzene dehydrogenase subunit delta [Aromatoleum bremense]|uniref:Ethylbenzene dehydrogenase n=1 Tax=Aromatoleum bremense TaxID=76115 RepID=A0ABX1NYQ5_9RHOO|nr:ethylbenzene dehydrogenase subunit delta [Aromatoleum bremense]NMG17190.1 ethylbenzene dehydrogenase [Aromatoleum bremense]QTQ29993.1 Ethylbenzene dehydrogenase, delta subunit [Aromatoleum bremense]